MNYMKDVAKLLGVEIGEEFKLDGNYPDIFRLTEKGLEFLYNGEWSSTSSTFNGILGGRKSIVKIPKPILDDIEKKYLSRVIKPFRNNVIFISKCISDDYKDECIRIEYKDYSHPTYLPYFKRESMYKGMELRKKYTLEELRL